MAQDPQPLAPFIHRAPPASATSRLSREDGLQPGARWTLKTGLCGHTKSPATGLGVKDAGELTSKWLLCLGHPVCLYRSESEHQSEGWDQPWFTGERNEAPRGKRAPWQ